MGKRLDYIKLLNDILSRFTEVVNSLWQVVKATKDKELIRDLSKFVSKYSSLNYEFSCYLISKTFKAYNEDKTEKEFNDIVGNNFDRKENDED